MFFKKKKRYSDYIIDLGKLKSRGIVPASESANAESSMAGSSEGIGFLGNLASSAETPASDSSYPTDSTAYDERDLPLSLRDKIRAISEKLYKIMDRIDLLEHKIDRIERRVGVRDEI